MLYNISPVLTPTIGEKLEREEVDILIKECCDPEDDDGFIPYERKLNCSRSRRPDRWHSVVSNASPWHLLFQLSWGGSVRVPTQRCTRIGKLWSLKNQPSNNNNSLWKQHSTIKTTAGCINNYMNQKTKPSTSTKDADRSRLLLISKFCYVSTFKSGF